MATDTHSLQFQLVLLKKLFKQTFLLILLNKLYFYNIFSQLYFYMDSILNALMLQQS